MKSYLELDMMTRQIKRIITKDYHFAAEKQVHSIVCKEKYSQTSFKWSPKMQRFSSYLLEVVAHGNPTTGGLIWEEFPTCLLFGREFTVCNF